MPENGGIIAFIGVVPDLGTGVFLLYISKLKNATPAEWYDFLKNNGYNPQPLGSRSSLKGIPFDQGGGFRINWGGDRYLQYHPPASSHHGGAYWKISSGSTGTRRLDLNGIIIY